MRSIEMGTILERVRRSTWLIPVLLGGLIGLVMLLVVLLVRSPRDTVILEIVPRSDAESIKVWVGGEVADPGLHALPRGSRVADAIEAAGGATDRGDLTALGMAAPVEDSDEIVVPRRQPVAASSAGATESASPPPAPAAGEARSSGAIDINTASAGELESLSGVGPVIASRIIEYRQTNGPFQSIEELASISGISDRMVEEFSPRITIGS